MKGSAFMSTQKLIYESMYSNAPSVKWLSEQVQN
jgi:hypothetical protein